jgi:hypothetical protein
MPLTIEYRALAELIPYVRNARTHDDAQTAQIAASIREFGWTNPVLVDGANGIIAGHGRVLAARKLGMDKVPCIELSHLSETQRRAYVIADNRLALNAGWDTGLLELEMLDLQDAGFDLALTGFGDIELTDLLDGSATDEPAGTGTGGGAGSLAVRFGVPPFSVLNAREGWWQDRKAAWIELGIRSELGRGDTGANTPHVGTGMADGLVALRSQQKTGRANATPSGSAMPPASLVNGRTVRGDGRGRRANAVPGGAKMPMDRGWYEKV